MISFSYDTTKRNFIVVLLSKRSMLIDKNMKTNIGQYSLWCSLWSSLLA